MNKKMMMGVIALSMSLSAWAQKDELKALRKIYDEDLPSKEQLATYRQALDKLKAMPLNEADKVYYNYYRVNLPSLEMMADGNGQPDMGKLMQFFSNTEKINDLAQAYRSVLDYEKKAGKEIFTEDITNELKTIKDIMMNTAVEAEKAKNYVAVSKLMHLLYTLDPADQEKLYYAANYAVTANQNEDAYKYYSELKKLKYTGEGTLYFAKNVATNVEEVFPTKEMRDQYVILKTHVLPREEQKTSKEAEIYKSTALLALKLGKNQEAINLFQEARTKFPEDVTLITSQADVYYQLNDLTKYNALIKEAIAKTPNDPDLYYNLGVTSRKQNNPAEALGYFEKATQIKADYMNAYLAMAEIKLAPDEKIVKEMNSLGTSDKDNKRYAVLQKQRESMFKEALPILEKAFQVDPNNEDVRKTLKGVYSALNMADKANALKN